MNLLLKKYSIAAGLSVLAHPHMLRHACGYALADQGPSFVFAPGNCDLLIHRNQTFSDNADPKELLAACRSSKLCVFSGIRLIAESALPGCYVTLLRKNVTRALHLENPQVNVCVNLLPQAA